MRRMLSIIFRRRYPTCSNVSADRFISRGLTLSAPFLAAVRTAHLRSFLPLPPLLCTFLLLCVISSQTMYAQSLLRLMMNQFFPCARRSIDDAGIWESHILFVAKRRAVDMLEMRHANRELKLVSRARTRCRATFRLGELLGACSCSKEAVL